jgi:DNA-binding transcriptional LysR family regulator
MELRQVRHFLAVAEHGSYAKAAVALGLSQSALTQSVRKLETELQVPILVRGRFGAVPTEFGQLLLDRGKAMISEERLITSEIDSLRHARRGQLRIGIGLTMSSNFMPSVIAKFQTRRPNVSMTIVEAWATQLFEQLRHGELDFAVHAAPTFFSPGDDLEEENLFDELDVIAIGRRHPLAAFPSPPLAELSKLTWLLPPDNDWLAVNLRRIFRDMGAEPPTRFLYTNSRVLAQSLIANGSAAGLVPYQAIRDPNDNRFFAFPISGFMVHRTARITRRKWSRLQPASEAFRQFIKKAAVDFNGHEFPNQNVS